MNIHAIQTGTVAIKNRQRVGQGGALRMLNTMLDREWTEPLPIYAWAIEHPEGVIVVDTGETARTSEPGYFPPWHPYYKNVRMSVQRDDEIDVKLRALGIPPEEVRWVVMTHLHTDHAGGLHHFPHSDILIGRAELMAAVGGLGKVMGYLPQHFPPWLKPRLVDFEEKPFETFPQSMTLTQAGDVHLVPTPGHTGGHLSVVLQEEGINVFFAGDVSYTLKAMLLEQVDGVSLNGGAAKMTLERTHKLYIDGNPTVYLPSHDPDAARRLEQRELRQAER